MSELYEDTLRFEGHDPTALLRQVATRAAEIAEVGGTVHAVDLAYEAAAGSATMIVTVTEAQARLLSYDDADLKSLRQQRVEAEG